MSAYVRDRCTRPAAPAREPPLNAPRPADGTLRLAASHRLNTSDAPPDRRVHPGLLRGSTSSGSPPVIEQMPRCDADEEMTQGGKICEVRRLSGLTWKQMAGIFGVTSRSVHFWVSGRPMSEAPKSPHRNRELKIILDSPIG